MSYDGEIERIGAAIHQQERSKTQQIIELQRKIGEQEDVIRRLRDKRRFKAACAAMQGMLASWPEHARFNIDTTTEAAAKWADALLAALDAKKEQSNGR